MEEDLTIDMESECISECPSVNTCDNIVSPEVPPIYSEITYDNNFETPSSESLKFEQDSFFHTLGNDKIEHIKVKEEIGELEKIKKDLDDELSISTEEINQLKKRADGVQRTEGHDELTFKGVKICATRHGCTGATNCDNSLGAPIGR